MAKTSTSTGGIGRTPPWWGTAAMDILGAPHVGSIDDGLNRLLLTVAGACAAHGFKLTNRTIIRCIIVEWRAANPGKPAFEGEAK